MIHKKLSGILLAFIVLIGVAGCKTSRVPEEDTVSVPTVFAYDGAEITVPDYLETEELFITELFGAKRGSYKVYDASELTLDTLKHRKGTTIIERCIGLVSNYQNGDAILLNPPDDCGYYLSYSSCDQEISDGTVLVSYMVYNPDTNYFDDIIERYDFVICRDYERGLI